MVKEMRFRVSLMNISWCFHDSISEIFDSEYLVLVVVDMISGGEGSDCFTGKKVWRR